MYNSGGKSVGEGNSERKSLTIDLGCCQSDTEVKTVLKRAGCIITANGDDLLRWLEWGRGSAHIISLVIVSDHDLGLLGEYSLQQLLERAKEKGYGICPSIVGPLARLGYHDQPVSEEVFVGMEPVYDDDGCSSLFILARNIETPILSGTFVRLREVFVSGKEKPNLWLLVAP
ncbi:hypothetical protein A2480_04535 [Candidatus Uhrbacteria bacterium RIFOXYC2_FULL_47_19]|uniref:Uncharacterized protein n=1 Tax=Candidatus Uhrbacteria bacterium RIFOXYC2_FULL_47_19 TaxID=1802424 RepID=A0A1F7WCM4_9BACT|nr:MAG: hypothetical protein A2480_04535 [Candidatus Uhrbacteria bacterium RIFOXYC2_FULL_47_19]HCC22333.1 hypothetical protein [Candidatus Uhrbacteria bacterium]